MRVVVQINMNATSNQLEDIAAAAMYAAEAVALDQVLERIAQISRELVKARYAAISVPDNEGRLKYFKTSGMSQDEIAQVDHLPEGLGLIGAVMTERQTIRLADMSTDSRSVGFCPGHPYMTSLLAVPIQIGQQLFGALYLCDREDGQAFDEQDQWLIEALSGYAALAIGNSELREQQNRLALLEERERIGMELHDGVIQSLYALGMHLDLLRTTENVAGNNLKPVMAGLNEVIEDIRRYILNLQTKAERQKTIKEHLTDILDSLHVPDSLDILIDAPEDKPPFTPVTFEAICLITNEAISNVVRHAEADHLIVRVQRKNGLFQINITDNGKGFDLNAINNQTGLGLRNIRQRARIYNGQVQIDTTLGEGTSLTISIPMRVI